MDSNNQFVRWIANAMSDGESPSSSRLIAVPTLLAVYLVPLVLWAVLSVHDRRLVEMPPSVLGFIGTVSVPLLTFVHWNKREETKAQAEEKPQP